ncbi:hypothetical protein DV704_00525 [Meiothermus sp. QL-1]|uniref:hypothetical protein n=1 Tax=Meiothermus sp. QL-1 TaxID=2058095 RepID=UPI000E0B6670|nr:hypothetical protein [Meiothermus sp. QL-1]RDI96732.1 hypothetical protein DV704_00525 [Meiothermus sp. QL-1]
MRLRLLLAAVLLAGFFFYSWRGLGEVFRERGRYTDALGLIPAATPPLRFGVPSLQELAVRYHLEPRQATCALCHLGRVESGRFNPFGEDYRAVVRRMLAGLEEQSIFQLSPAQIRQALAEATQDGLDSDGDGYDNDLELLFGFLPGEARSRPHLPVETLEAYRTMLRQAARDGRLEALRRRGAGQADPTLFGFAPGEVPLVRLERLALYQAVILPASPPAAFPPEGR